MSQEVWDANELRRIRQWLEQLELELTDMSGRLGELERIAAHHFGQKQADATAQLPEGASAAGPATVVPPIAPLATKTPSISEPPETGETLGAGVTRAESTLEPAAVGENVPVLGAGAAEELKLATEEPRSAGFHAGIPHRQTAASAAAAPARSRRPEKSWSAIDWEGVIGGRWMTWVGAFTLLLAVGFGVHWAWTTLETPPWLHVLACHLLGVGFLGGAFFLRRRGVPLAVQALVGLGIFTLYAAAFAALHLYRLWSEQTAFVECAAITALAIGLAVRANSPAVVLLGALGGFLTPILTANNSGNYVGLFTYLAFLNVALVSCAVWKEWSFLKPLALAATALMFSGWWLNEHFDPNDSGMVWGTEWFAALHAGIFLVGSTLPPVAWKRRSRTADLVALVADSFFFIGVTWVLFRDRPGQQLALVSWGMAALHAALFGVTFKKLTNADRMPRVHLALAAAFFTLAIPLQIDDSSYWSATWCVEGFVFTAVGVYFADRQMCVSAAAVLVLAAGRLINWDWNDPARAIGNTGIDVRFAVFLACGLLTMLSGGLYRLVPALFPAAVRRTRECAIAGLGELEELIATCLSAIGAVLVTMSPLLQLTDLTYLAPAWVVEALAFTVVGLLARDRQLRVTAAVVFSLAAGRLVTFDWHEPAKLIGNTGVDLRFAVFLGSGLLMMLSGGLCRLAPKMFPAAQRVRDNTESRQDETKGLHGIEARPEIEELIATWLSGLGAILVTMSPVLQLKDMTFLAPAWGLEALAFTVVGLLARDRQLRVTAVVVFCLAGGRLIGFDFSTEARSWHGTEIDVRSAAFGVVGILSLVCGAIYRVAYRRRSEELRRSGQTSEQPAGVYRFDDPAWVNHEFNRLAAMLLIVLGAVLVTCTTPLQLDDWIMLAPIWTIEALAFIGVAAVFDDALLGVIGLAIFVTGGVRLGWVFGSEPHRFAGTMWDARFVAAELSGLMAILAGAMYWWIPRWTGRAKAIELSARTRPGENIEVQPERLIGGILLAAGNVVMMLGLTCQWDNRFVLMAWTLDTALVWAAGFRWNFEMTRWYAASLAVLMVGGRAVLEGARLDGPFVLIANTRFAALALVAILYFAAGGMYRRRTKLAGKKEELQALFHADLRHADESQLDPLFGILANATLLIALSMEIHSWYLAAAANDWTPFADMQMAEMATYSIVWAIYAAIMVAVGFAIRYQLFRLLGLAAFGVIVLKVFFIDLESLRWLPRVLALAVLGMTLMGVSMLYQKFFAKTQQVQS